MNATSSSAIDSAAAATAEQLPAKAGLRLCRKCWRPVAPEFRYCPYCGELQTKGEAWYYHPVWVTVLALTLLGPIAIPLVWKSARMNRAVKIVLTVVILIYTAVTVYYAYVILRAQLRMLSDMDFLYEY